MLKSFSVTYVSDNKPHTRIINAIDEIELKSELARNDMFFISCTDISELVKFDEIAIGGLLFSKYKSYEIEIIMDMLKSKLY